jgi:thiol-disulfide isomerase/thioredoxin
MRLGSADHRLPQDEALLDAYQTSWLKVAKLVGIEAETVLPVRQIEWSKVERTPLDNFAVVDLNGRRWSLQDWRGKVVLVNMWATWCTPCRAELPYIQKLYDALKGRTDRLVIPIDVDSGEELARRLVPEHGYTFPVLTSRSLTYQIDFVQECRRIA